MRSPFSFTGIYAILEPQRRESLAYARMLLAGGVRIVQVRAKSGVDRDLLRVLVPIVRGYNGIVIVNDDVDAALEADGLHLGQEDAAIYDLPALRARLGNRILGLSCGTPGEAQRVDPSIVDYLGVGPIFTTHSKADAGGAIGVNGVRAVATATNVPCVAIGGIDAANLARVKESGVQMAAIISALADARDPQALARELTQIWSGS